MSTRTVVVGVDCATDASRIGLARAEERDEGAWFLTDAQLGTAVASIAGAIASWLSGPDRGLIALDAPLGWPATLGSALSAHGAGQRLVGSSEELFRRRTDLFVEREVGKRSLDVGADRIARTARSALELLDQVRLATHSAIPLAWSHEFSSGTQAIEVYPAATLEGWGLPSSRYKKPAEGANRDLILERLRGRLVLAPHENVLRASADTLDAAICAAAGIDFLAGESLAPDPRDLYVVKQEGWIWVRDPARRAPSVVE